ncbi:RRN3 [Mytilus coruscus]|uniref:RRN3 n=1 Tax=Mytilus coruscus TaxID=42192 RepID=A0A6J8DPV3_MYTCO|nr:RRN3 [Mytilus coruscus]
MAMTTSSKSSKLDFESILEKQKQGYYKDYDWLTSRLSDPDIETSELQTYIRSIRKCVTHLDRDYEILVGIMLKLNWATRESCLIKEYQAFLLNLVSAHTYYLRAGVRMLVKHFMSHLTLVTKTGDGGDKNVMVTVDDSLRQKHDLMFVNVHLVLKAITHIVPMTPKVLIPLLGEMFPFFNKDVYIQECYVKNLLQITHYLPNMRQKILEIVIERLLKFDVRSPREEIEELQREEDEDMEDIIFEMDDVSVQKEIVSSVDMLSIVETVPMTHKEGHKLDILMEITFRYIQNMCYSEGELNWEATKLLYRELLLIFETSILPTHASCHVQFIMFYICSLKQPICDGFLDYLWKKVQNPIAQPVYRQISVCYIGSLLSRGIFVPISTVKTCLELMSTWIHKYLDQTGDESLFADVTHHGPFYAVVQAILYVFVFRNKDIFESRKGLKWAEKLNFQRIVTCRLNPLKFCLPVIVQTFASVARSHQLAFCDTIIERNNRQVLPVACTNGNLDFAGKMLDSFFPFDPYILSRSRKYILPLYREYQGSIEEGDDEEENEEDDFITEDIISPSNGKFTIGSLSKTPSDFMEYGVSPGFKHVQDMT